MTATVDRVGTRRFTIKFEREPRVVEPYEELAELFIQQLRDEAERDIFELRMEHDWQGKRTKQASAPAPPTWRVAYRDTGIMLLADLPDFQTIRYPKPTKLNRYSTEPYMAPDPDRFDRTFRAILEAARVAGLQWTGERPEEILW